MDDFGPSNLQDRDGMIGVRRVQLPTKRSDNKKRRDTEIRQSKFSS